MDGKWPPDVYREIWGRWAGREAAFYRACASRVRPLDWARVAAIGGAEVRLLAAVVRDAFTALRSEEPPPALRPGPFTILGMGPEVRHIQTYSGFDPLEAPARLLDALPYFDGRTTEEAIAVIGEQQGVEIDKGLVRKLADFEILTPAGDGV
ncbi:MAG: hypothetical protein HYR60_29005 [Acidobacteria bacterium]|nr:hypothetical protein [Acidobacteriota bacterium]